MLNDFETIAKEIKNNTDKINENNFIIRLVICYEENDKAKNETNYNKLLEYIKILNNLTFEERRKENKYFYLLNKKDFENETDFLKLKQMFSKKDKNDNYKILTINLNNLAKYEKLLQSAINIEIENKK